MNSMKVAYLVNHYPKVSHTFIRREIIALESMGLQISRLSVRGWDNELVDPVDVAERQKTRYLLEQGVFGLLKAACSVFLKRPNVFLSAVRTAIKMGLHADRAWPYHLVYLLEACKALQLLEEENIHHVHAHFGKNSAEVAMLIHLLGGPTYSFTVHGSEEFDKPEYIKFDKKVEHCAFVVAVTSYCRSQIYRWISHAHWNKVKLVRCGIESSFYENLPDTFPVEPRLVCVGRLCEQKAQLLLLAAAAKLKEKAIDFQLVLAGDGEMRAEVEREIDKLGLSENVCITGWISSDQVREEILRSRALVVSSFAEGLPVVIMEAMALKRPIISTHITGIPELVTCGSNGFLCPAGDVDALAAHMETCLLADENTLRRLGNNAQAAVLAQHHITNEASKLVDLFTNAKNNPC